MRTPLALTTASCALLLAACASTQPSGPSNWGYKPGEAAAPVMSEAEFEQTSAQVVDLRKQRNTLAGVARDSNDPGKRAEAARGIPKIDDSLRQLEYRLRAANRPLPR